MTAAELDFRPGFLADQFRMDGKTALIIGGHGNLAEAMAATLADLGCNLALAARKQQQCAELAGKLEVSFEKAAIGLQCDVSNEDSIVEAVAAVCDKFGSIDVLINNAGASWWGLPEEIPLSGWQKVIDVNLTGAFLTCREVARRMIDYRGGGSIINIASAGAFMSYVPDEGRIVPYTTSKAGLVHLTQDLAAQWAGHGIRVNAIAPGSLVTGMTETIDPEYKRLLVDSILLKRLGLPTETTAIVATLASGAGSFITGQTIVIDGGQTLA